MKQHLRTFSLLLLTCGAAHAAPFSLAVQGIDNNTLSTRYTCDGEGLSPALSWSDVPAGTRELALLMTTRPRDGGTKWNWVLYAIPANTRALAEADTRVGTAGIGSDGPQRGYQPPCSKGPGAKSYTFTLYALSAPLDSASRGKPLSGEALQAAIEPITLASAAVTVTATRTASNTSEAPPDDKPRRPKPERNRGGDTAPPPNTPAPAPAPASASAGSSSGDSAAANCRHIQQSFAALAPNSATVRCDADYAYIESNGLPRHTMMQGITASNLQVPIAQAFTGDNAWRIPLRPTLSDERVSAVDGPIGMAVNGVPIFNPCKQGGCDRGDTKVQGELDICNGHAGRADDYHYHAAPVCLMAEKPQNFWDTHPLGWALDGFAIFGYNNPQGQPAARDDECGGNSEPVVNGPAGYSYHVTDASPYVLSCFRGVPSPDLANQKNKFRPIRKPPVKPFAVSHMQWSTDAQGYQVVSFTSPRPFTATSTGNDSFNNPAGKNQIRYKALSGEALQAALAQGNNRNKTLCWQFEFGPADDAALAEQVYCR